MPPLLSAGAAGLRGLGTAWLQSPLYMAANRPGPGPAATSGSSQVCNRQQRCLPEQLGVSELLQGQRLVPRWLLTGLPS